VSASDFSTVKMIGQGAFGTVLLVKKKSNGRLFAMKVCVCV
jgi:serine/threonine protein kinase